MHAGVRKNALMVLTHLILNDMMKVRHPAVPQSRPATPLDTMQLHLFDIAATRSISKGRETCGFGSLLALLQ